MIKLTFFILTAIAGGPAIAQVAAIDGVAMPSCTAAATERKLFGAAKTSFLKKCEKDATTGCESAAANRKLVGAAKNSHVKKCVREAVGE